MKKKFVFDSMESDFSNINEESIIENTGVNTERVVKTVMEATKAKKFRRFTKKGIIGLAAAVAAAVAIGTVSAGAAMGGFNQAFGNWFAGQPKYGLFSGSNISSKSDNINVELNGIAGDDNFVGAVMTIQNKDGSKFVDNAQGEYLIFGGNNIDVTIPPIAVLFGQDYSRGGSVCYELYDENTIKATAFYQDENKHIKGERMTVTEEELLIMHLDEEIGTYLDSYDSLIEKYKDKLGKDQAIFSHSKSGAYEDGKYYIVTEKTVPCEFELSVTLNYKTSSRALNDLNGTKLSMNDVDMTINGMQAKSFGINMDATVGAIDFPEAPDFDGMDEIEISKAQHEYIEKMDAMGFKIELDITMKDGTKLTAESDTRLIASNNITSSAGSLYLPYQKDGKNIAVDPDDIVSVTATAKPLS